MWVLQIIVSMLCVMIQGQIFDTVTPPAFMYAPYTPFIDDSPVRPSINYSAIPTIVKEGIGFGANLFWIGGSNGQFTALSVDERKQLVLGYCEAVANYSSSIYMVYHVSATRIDDAVELAHYARELHSLYGLPQSIAILPPYYNRVSSTDAFEQLFAWMKPIIAASGDLPTWYYHHPSRSAYDIHIFDLLTEAITNDKLSQLEGVKFNMYDLADLFKATSAFGSTIAVVPYYAVNLALVPMYGQTFGYGATDFEIPMIQCMQKATEQGRVQDAYWYQNFKNQAAVIFGNAVGRRCIYQRFGGLQLGPPRPPMLKYTQEQCQDIIDALESELDFFNTLQNIKNDETCTPP